MFGGIPYEMLDRYAKSCGCYTQLPLFETPPQYTINEEYCCDVFAGWNCEVSEHGVENISTVRYEDHPAFASLRQRLSSSGFIKTQHWCNGDTVLKEFFLNGVLFQRGDQFPSAVAIKHRLSRDSIDTEETFDFFFDTPYDGIRNEQQEKWEW